MFLRIPCRASLFLSANPTPVSPPWASLSSLTTTIADHGCQRTTINSRKRERERIIILALLALWMSSPPLSPPSSLLCAATHACQRMLCTGAEPSQHQSIVIESENQRPSPQLLTPGEGVRRRWVREGDPLGAHVRPPLFSTTRLNETIITRRVLGLWYHHGRLPAAGESCDVFGITE